MATAMEPQSKPTSPPDAEQLPVPVYDHDVEAIEHVQGGYTAVRLMTAEVPKTRQLPPELKDEALELFGGMDVESLRLVAELWAKEDLQPCTDILNRLRNLWHDTDYTLTYPEPGIRLVKRGQLEPLIKEFEKLRSQLTAEARRLGQKLPEIKRKRAAALKRAFDAENYNIDPAQFYRIEWKVVNLLEVPSYLEHNETLYRKEARKINETLRQVVRLEEARMAKQAMEAWDAILERLEPQRYLDDRWVVKDVLRRQTDKGVRMEVVVQIRKDDPLLEPLLSRQQKRPTTQSILLTQAEFKRRVTVNHAERKRFQEGTLSKAFLALQQFKARVAESGIGNSREMVAAFEEMDKTLKGHNAGTLASLLKEGPDESRKRIAKQSKKLVNTLLELPLLQPARSIIRGRLKSRTANPDKA